MGKAEYGGYGWIINRRGLPTTRCALSWPRNRTTGGGTNEVDPCRECGSAADRYSHDCRDGRGNPISEPAHPPARAAGGRRQQRHHGAQRREPSHADFRQAGRGRQSPRRRRHHRHRDRRALGARRLYVAARFGRVYDESGGATRAATLPDLPTMAEAGVPGYDASNWWAVAAPAGTPAATVAKLSAAITTYLNLPETQKRFTTEGAEVDIRTPAELKKMIPLDMAKWARVAKEAGMRAE